MKFTDGLWLHQPGVTAHYVAETHAAAREGNEILLTGTTQVVRSRGQTLQGPLLDIRLTPILPGIIKVRIEHYSGGNLQKPLIPLQPQPEPVADIVITETEASLTCGSLTAKTSIKSGGWDLSFTSGDRFLTKSAYKAAGYVQWPSKNAQSDYIFEQLHLSVGETVYGFGERFTAFVKNGQVIENTNKDGGTSSDQAYKSIPFYLTNRGYGVLINETGPVSFEIASEKIGRAQFSLAGESLEYFIIDGPTPLDVIARLTQLTGRPALPPAWSFGLWLSTSFTTNYDEPTCMQFIDEMKKRDLPLRVFHFDCFWMREFHWSDLEFDPATFPDPAGMLTRLHAKGLKVSVWINSYIAQRSRLFAEGKRLGYFLKKADGSVWQSDQWQPGMAIVDFTNPAACAWYAGYLRALLDLGVDGFKTDFGERIPTDVVYFDGSDPEGMHNLYPVLYNETVFSAIEQARGKGEAIVFSRSAYASSQRFPLHWGGDCWSSFESMAESLRGGLSLSLCGFGFWSHDIGGFEGNGSPAVYKRWIAFGLLSSHSRLHGSGTYRIPWAYDEEACDVLRLFTKLKCRLMPYLFAKAVEAHQSGHPMLRAMLLEFPADPASDTLDRQYMLGDSILVAPVMTPDGSASFYLPAGTWTHLLTGEVLVGGGWHTTAHDFFGLPLYVRGGSILAFGTEENVPDYDYAEGVTFRIYALEAGASATCSIYAVDGTPTRTLTAKNTDGVLTAEISGTHTGPWQVQIVGQQSVSSLVGASIVTDPPGVFLLPTANSKIISAQI